MATATRPAWPYPRYIAHRGGGKLAPENTLAAMRCGHAHGYRMVEFDVKLSGDGTLFLLHDATLERTTNGRGRADAFTWNELARLDAGSWHSPAFTGETIPTFAAIARYCIASGIACNVEIKATPGRERETGAAVALEAKALWDGAPLAPLLSSFDQASLEGARDAAKELTRALLCEKLDFDWLDRLAVLDCVALDCDYRVLSSDVVSQAQRAGYRTLCYTPNDPKAVADLTSWGVDGIITDAIDVIRPDD